MFLQYFVDKPPLCLHNVGKKNRRNHEEKGGER